MPSIKEYNVKLKSLKNTEKMTRTMKLVSMSKLYKAQEAQKRGKIYASRLAEMISRLAATLECSSHPLAEHRPQVKNALILVVTSDRGLCGAFNNTIIKGVRHWLTEHRGAYEKIDLSFCGKRGYMALRKQEGVRNFYENATGHPKYEAAHAIGEDIVKDFLGKKYDEVYLTYNMYNSPLSQKPVFLKILPLEPQILQGGAKYHSEYIFEPPAAEFLDFLIPKYMYFEIYFALLENSAGEHGARMTAMDSASKNAAQIIDRFTLYRNRARQANITRELIEIVSGAEALK